MLKTSLIGLILLGALGACSSEIQQPGKQPVGKLGGCGHPVYNEPPQTVKAGDTVTVNFKIKQGACTREQAKVDLADHGSFKAGFEKPASELVEGYSSDIIEETATDFSVKFTTKKLTQADVKTDEVYVTVAITFEAAPNANAAKEGAKPKDAGSLLNAPTACTFKIVYPP